MRTDPHCHLVRVWDTTAEERFETLGGPGRPCDVRVMLERRDELHLHVPPMTARDLAPGTIVLFNVTFNGVPIVRKPALVLRTGQFAPDGHPIVDVVADPEYLPED
jgi:hypothetical protein